MRGPINEGTYYYFEKEVFVPSSKFKRAQRIGERSLFLNLYFLFPLSFTLRENYLFKSKNGITKSEREYILKLADFPCLKWPATLLCSSSAGGLGPTSHSVIYSLHDLS